jgi:hypothetical protein
VFKCACVLDQPCTLPSETQVSWIIFCMHILPHFQCIHFELEMHKINSLLTFESLISCDSEWANVEEDCKKALELDNTSVKVLMNDGQNT